MLIISYQGKRYKNIRGKPTRWPKLNRILPSFRTSKKEAKNSYHIPCCLSTNDSDHMCSLCSTLLRIHLH